MALCGSCAQSSPTLCDPIDCSPPGSSIHGISQARILEWVAKIQWIFPTQGLNLCLLHLLHWRQILRHKCDLHTGLVTSTTVIWKTKRLLNDGYTGQRDDSLPGLDPMWWCEISSATQNGAQFKTYGLFISGIFHLMFWPRVTENMKSKTMDKWWLCMHLNKMYFSFKTLSSKHIPSYVRTGDPTSVRWRLPGKGKLKILGARVSL